MGAAALRSAATVGMREPSGLPGKLLRYGLTSCGPLAISGAHFAALLLFLRGLSRADFGLLSFLMTVLPFCLSLSGAFVGASVARVAAQSGGVKSDELATHLKASLLFSLAVTVCVLALMAGSRAAPGAALLCGLYAGLMSFRWFGRNVGYALGTPYRVAISDFVYAAVLLASLAFLFLAHRFDVLDVSLALFAAAFAGLAALGIDFAGRTIRAATHGSLAAFGPVWRELARWSVLGVFLTELTANAHAYLVTFAFGPAAFALLAVGSLLMRPVVLVLSALPDFERPEMARRLAAGDTASALRRVKEFRTAAGAVWLATLVLAGAVLMWFPHLILKHGYDSRQVLVVLGLWGAITVARVARTPESVFLQAAGEFKGLARASAWSSVASLAATLALMFVFGPVASLGGILLGEIVMTGRIFSLSSHWRRAHG